MNFPEWWCSSDREYYFDWEPEHGYCHEKDLAEAAWNTARTMTPVSKMLPTETNAYLVLCENGELMKAIYDAEYKLWGVAFTTVAYWMELPEVPG